MCACQQPDASSSTNTVTQAAVCHMTLCAAHHTLPVSSQAQSKPMREILARLTAGGEFEVVTFGDKVRLCALATAHAAGELVTAHGMAFVAVDRQLPSSPAMCRLLLCCVVLCCTQWCARQALQQSQLSNACCYVALMPVWQASCSLSHALVTLSVLGLGAKRHQVHPSLQDRQRCMQYVSVALPR